MTHHHSPHQPLTREQKRFWDKVLAPYKGPDTWRSVFQLTTTAFLFVVLWFLMLKSLEVSYFLTLLLALPTAGMVTRLFIIQHDCGHGSYFRSAQANNLVGFLLGVITLTPYQYWRRTHAIHHATSGNLDRREFGDVNTLTVKEYQALPFLKRLGYRIYRNTFVLFFIGPTYQFVLKHRFPFDAPLKWTKEWISVIATNVALVAVILVMWQTVGMERFLMVQIPLTLIMGTLGIWLFYVQHQFEDTYWERREAWDFHVAGLAGSSFYDLPRILHWFTGNIGYHHIHHLSSAIPNYRLAQCMREVPELQHVTRLKLWESLKCIRYKLWDEDERRLVGFGHLRQRAEAS